VTFLFTDVEGSTRRWEADAQEMGAALVVHDKVLRTAIEASDGFCLAHLRPTPGRRTPIAPRPTGMADTTSRRGIPLTSRS
jgi:class 3 adenylate cyclase